MLYLAQIQRRFLPRALGLNLLAVQRQDGLWRLMKPEIISVSSDATNLGDDRLVIVDLSATRQLVQISNGVTAIPAILHSLSLQLFKLSKRDQEIIEWRESLVFQSAELGDRKEALEAGEESLKVHQEMLTAEKSAFIQERSAFIQEKSVFERDRAALAKAWESVRLEQARLSTTT